MIQPRKPCWPPRALLLAALAGSVVLLSSASRLLPPAFCLPPSAQAVADDVPPDPVPIRRVVLPPERLPAEMQRVGRGVLVRMSRAEFEASVRRAGLAAAALRDPPRLIEAHYRASLADTALVGGTAEWKVINPAPAAGILALQPCNLALQKGRVQKARFDTTEAVVGDLDGKTPGLLVERPGEHAVLLDWTARGDPRPAGLHFSLQLPACPVASLELDLPADRVLASQDTFLVSGPHEAESPQRRRWRIDFAGRSQLDLEIRRAPAGDQAPLVLAELKSRQVLEPELLQADYDFTLEVPHQALRELRCECDPALRPLDVIVPGLESWEPQPGASPGSPTVLVIRLREPFQAGPLRVRCLARLPVGRRWFCPAVRLAGAVLRSETLVLAVHPDVRLENWQPGSFRLATPRPPDPSAGRTPEEGWQVLSLVGGEPGDRAGPDRPRADLRTGGADIRVRQLSWWQVGSAGSTLTVRAGFEVTRGRLFQLSFGVPAGWFVEQVDLSPPDLLHGWAPVREDRQATLVVDLERPVEPGSVARATVRLRAAGTERPAGMTVRFPDLVPMQARWRQGALAISIDPVYQAQAECRDSPQAMVRDLEEPPWGRQTPDYYYPYRALTPQESRQPALEGVLRLQPRHARFGARCTTRIVTQAGRAALALELVLRPEVGSPEAIDLLLSAPVSGVRGGHLAAVQTAAGLGVLAARSPLAAVCLLARPPYEPVWTWQVRGQPHRQLEARRWWPAEAATRLSALAGRSPLEVASLLAAPPPGEWWRLALGRPLRAPLTLRTTFDLTSPEAPAASGPQPRPDHAAGPWPWPVPLPSVPAADPMEGEVRLEVAAAHGFRIASAAGFSEDRADARAGLPSPWRALRYGRQGAALTLAAAAAPAPRFAEEAIDRARLTTWVGAGGRLLHAFRFQVRNWRQQTLPLRLPPGTRPLAAKEDGRWIARLEPSRMVDGALEVPVAAGPGSHLVEILYVTDVPAWTLWARLESPAPELPVAPLAFRRTWRLPPGVRPLFEEAYQRLPGPAGGWAERLQEQTAGLLSPLASAWDSGLSSAPDWLARQRRLIRNAGSAWQGRDPFQTVWRLGDVLERMAYEDFRGGEGLVLDTAALAEVGLTPASRLPAQRVPLGKAGKPLPPWERWGLALVPCRPAVLLTSRRHQESWQASAGQAAPVPASVSRAVAAAAAQAHDSSGRFRTVVDWLESQDGGAPPEPSAGPGPSGSEAAMFTDSLGGEWTEWEPRAGNPPDEPLLVARPDLLPGFGLALALGLAGAAWSIRRFPGRARLAFFLFWLGGSGLAVMWLPPTLRPLAWWPALAGAGLAVGWYAWWLASVKRRPGLGTPAAAGLLSLLALGMPGRSEAPTGFTVFLIPAAGKDAGAQSLLAPAEQLERLRALTRRAAPWQDRAVLVAARYEGAVAGGTAELTAELEVHCFADGVTNLTLPLGGVQLKEALVDGAATRPVAVSPPREAYRLEVKGRGAHTVRLQFEVPVSASGGDRSVRFAVPTVVQSRLLLEVPADARYVQAVGGYGAQRLPAAGPAPVAPRRFEADLGRVGTVHVRWRQEGPHPAPALVRIREGYLWDLAQGGNSLVALLQYTVAQGAVTALVVELPGDMAVRSVEAARLPDAAADEPIPRLRQWQVMPQGHRLRVEFQRPVTRGVQLTLELVPRTSLGSSPVLTVPVPLGTRPPSEQGQPPLLAYRVEGRRARVSDNLRISRLDDRQIFRDWWQSAGRADPGPGTNVFVFQRGPGGPPFLRLLLSARPTVESCWQDIRWQVGRQRVEVVATANLVAPTRDLMLVEWQVGTLTVAEVSGPDIRNWSQTGSHVQVWLRRPVGEASLQLTGWLPRGDDVPPAPAGAATGRGGPVFRLAPLPIRGAQATRASVRVAGADGQELRPEGLWNLLPSPGPRPSDRAFSYVTEQADYGGAFRAQPARPGVDVHGLTLAATRDGQVTFTAVLDCQVRDGGLHRLTVRLRHWAGGEARLEGTGLLALREDPADPGGRAWVAVLGPDAPGRQRLTVTGSMPREPATDILMPDVAVAEAARSQRWLAVTDSRLTATDAHGLVRVDNVADALKPWAGQVGRVALAWKITAPDWRLRLRPHAAVIGSGPVRVFLSEHVATVADGQRWVHQATYRLYNELGSDLSVSLPQAATLLGASVDGVEVTPLPAARGSLRLPLSAAWGARVVSVRWVLAGGAEPLDRPDLERPRLAGVTDGPTLWTIHVPAGYGARRRGDNPEAAPAGAPEQDLARAAAQLELSAVLAAGIRNGAGDVLGPQLIAAQERFYRYCRLAALGLPQGTANPALVQLKERNVRLAGARAFQALRAQAETDAGAVARGLAEAPWAALPTRGTPLHWIGRPQDASPRLRLHAPRVHQRRDAIVTSVLLLAALLVLWILAGYPSLLVWIRTLWPEQLVLLGCLGWCALSPGWPFLALVILGAGARLAYLGGWVVSLLHGQPDGSNDGSVVGGSPS